MPFAGPACIHHQGSILFRICCICLLYFLFLIFVSCAIRVMIAALSFLLDYEKIEDDTDSDESSDEDELAKMPTVISKEAIYKV